MKFCPFCGSPAAAWPEYASDYVRGYPLCEHHMSRIVEKATVAVYDTDQAKISDRQGIIIDRLTSFISNMDDEYGKSPVFEGRVDSRFFNRRCEVSAEFIDKIYDALPEESEKGPPSKVYMDESEVDRLVSARITSFARDVSWGKQTKRCSAQRDGKPDNRCINRAEIGSDRCQHCKDKINRPGSIGKDKLHSIMEMIRDD